MQFDFSKVEALIADEADIVVGLSGSSIQLIFTAILFMQDKWRWINYEADDYDEIESWVALACYELMQKVSPVIEIGTVLYTLASDIPDYGIPCNGTLYGKIDYPLLYDVIDDRYKIGAGVDKFYAPDIQDRFILGKSASNVMNEEGGEENHQLTTNEMPGHTHGFSNYIFGIDIESVGIPDPTGVGSPKLPTETTQSSGGGNSHNNVPPYTVLRHYIVAELP